MRILVDVDYTLFDTIAMRSALVAAFRDLGVTKMDYQIAERNATRKVPYTMERHFAAIAGAMPAITVADLESRAATVFEEADAFVYPDVADFFARHAGIPTTILTFGAPAFQEFKVRTAGLEQYADEVVAIDTSKAEYIQLLPKDEMFVSLNDRGSEIDAAYELRPDIYSIHVHRAGTPYANVPSVHASERVNDLSSVQITTNE